MHIFMKFHSGSQHFPPNTIGPPISTVLCAPKYEFFTLRPGDSSNDSSSSYKALQPV